MDYEKTKSQLLDYVNNNNSKKFNEFVKNNESTLKDYFNISEHVKDFVKEFNKIILSKFKEKDLYTASDLLKNEIFINVYSAFRKSTILIEAIKSFKTEIIEWLLTKDIKLNVQDETGKTALMYAVQNWKMVFIAEHLLKADKKGASVTDNEGNTALYYAVSYLNMFIRILKATKDINHRNNNDESIFIYCCKKKIFLKFDEILNMKKLDIELNYKEFYEDCKKNILEFALEGKHQELSYIYDQFRLIMENSEEKYDIKDELNHVIIPAFVEKYYLTKLEGDEESNLKMTETMKVFLNEYPIDYNCPIDEDGNTLLMFFFLTKSYKYVESIIEKPNIDLSVKNKYGINASFLSIISDKSHAFIRKKLMENSTFDYDFVDDQKNNLLIHCIIRDYNNEASSIIYKNKKYISQINDKKENAIIVAVKSNHSTQLDKGFFIDLDDNAINQQDELGNTALHYAVQLRDKYAINLLSYFKANKNLTNNQGQSALDIAQKFDDKKIMKYLNQPKLKPKEEYNGSGSLFKMFFSGNSDSNEGKTNIYKKDYDDLIERSDQNNKYKSLSQFDVPIKPNINNINNNRNNNSRKVSFKYVALGTSGYYTKKASKLGYKKIKSRSILKENMKLNKEYRRRRREKKRNRKLVKKSVKGVKEIVEEFVNDGSSISSISDIEEIIGNSNGMTFILSSDSDSSIFDFDGSDSDGFLDIFDLDFSDCDFEGFDLPNLGGNDHGIFDIVGDILFDDDDW